MTLTDFLIKYFEPAGVFADNNTKAITESILRTFASDISSLILENAPIGEFKAKRIGFENANGFTGLQIEYAPTAEGYFGSLFFYFYVEDRLMLYLESDQTDDHLLDLSSVWLNGCKTQIVDVQSLPPQRLINKAQLAQYVEEELDLLVLPSQTSIKKTETDFTTAGTDDLIVFPQTDLPHQVIYVPQSIIASAVLVSQYISFLIVNPLDNTFYEVYFYTPTSPVVYLQVSTYLPFPSPSVPYYTAVKALVANKLYKCNIRIIDQKPYVEFVVLEGIGSNV